MLFLRKLFEMWINVVTEASRQLSHFEATRSPCHVSNLELQAPLHEPQRTSLKAARVQ